MSDLFSVKGKVVVVTGGGKGIGRHISEGFVKNGAKVYICSRDAKSLEKTAAELTKLGPGECIAIQCDLQSYDAIARFVDELKKREKAVNVLVNNSGASWGAEIEEYPDSAWTKLMTLNVQRVFTLTQLMLPLLEAASGGKAPVEDPARIINIGSVNGLTVPAVANYAYSASKAAVHHLSRHLAVDLGPRGITSNTLACGPFQSKMMAATLEAAGDMIKEGVPLKRIGSDKDVAGACIFLASRAGAWVNGATISLDGGAHLSKL